MIFGLSESEGENLKEKVDGVFEELGIKPKHAPTRLGLKKNSNVPRPVKVCVSNSALVLQLLRKAKDLHKSEVYKKVFIAPDRSLDDRSQRRVLVTELKKKRAEEPDKRHFLRGGTVCTANAD